LCPAFIIIAVTPLLSGINCLAGAVKRLYRNKPLASQRIIRGINLWIGIAGWQPGITGGSIDIMPLKLYPAKNIIRKDRIVPLVIRLCEHSIMLIIAGCFIRHIRCSRCRINRRRRQISGISKRLICANQTIQMVIHRHRHPAFRINNTRLIAVIIVDMGIDGRSPGIIVFRILYSGQRHRSQPSRRIVSKHLPPQFPVIGFRRQVNMLTVFLPSLSRFPPLPAQAVIADMGIRLHRRGSGAFDKRGWMDGRDHPAEGIVVKRSSMPQAVGDGLPAGAVIYSHRLGSLARGIIGQRNSPNLPAGGIIAIFRRADFRIGFIEAVGLPHPTRSIVFRPTVGQRPGLPPCQIRRNHRHLAAAGPGKLCLPRRTRPRLARHTILSQRDIQQCTFPGFHHIIKQNIHIRPPPGLFHPAEVIIDRLRPDRRMLGIGRIIWPDSDNRPPFRIIKGAGYRQNPRRIPGSQVIGVMSLIRIK